MNYAFPPARPLSPAEKTKDLMRLISDGRSILAPPPSVGATKATAPMLADAHRIRGVNPPNDHGDALAEKIVARVDPAERAAKIEHLRVYGSCSSRLWMNTRLWTNTRKP